MPHSKKQVKDAGALGRVSSAVKRLFSRRTTRPEGDEPAMRATAPRQEGSRSEVQSPRVTRREADIPMDVVDRSYTPPMTSSKAGFRTDGADHQRDQEFAFTSATDKWNDEDHYTNKSGDPRIGTHQRTYEPGEDRDASRQ